MIIMEEEKVRRCLDDLLVKLEVFWDDKEIKNQTTEEFIRIVNFYKDNYHSIFEEYHDKAREVLRKYKK